MELKETEHTLKKEHVDTIRTLLKDMKFGNITIIVQDGKIIQIDKTEKYRLK